MKGIGAAAVVGLLAFVIAGCGGGGDASSSATTTQAQAQARGPQPPKGASALQRQVYRTFQPPRADPEVAGSGRAIEAGEAACEGKTPVQVKERFIAASKLSAAQRRALAQIDRAEAHPSGDFAAGQLAALVYEGTLGGKTAEYGYRGCVYALARGLEGR